MFSGDLTNDRTKDLGFSYFSQQIIILLSEIISMVRKASETVMDGDNLEWFIW
jgi:hypothetical protein